MQFTRALVFLVCASYTLAVTCAVCPDEITAVPFASKCYKPGELTDDGPGETVCLYVSRNDVWTGLQLTNRMAGTKRKTALCRRPLLAPMM